MKPLFALSLALSLFLSSAQAIDGLLGYWSFEEGAGDVAADSSGNANDGEVLEPGDAWVNDPDRGAVYQSGNGSYIDFGTILPVIDLDTDFTWSFWVNAAETDNNNIVFGNRWGPDGVDFTPREFIKFTPRVFEWHFEGGGENVPGGDTMFVVDEWAHNLVTKSGETLTYYRDGVELASSEISAAPTNPQPLYLGGQNGNENFSGLFDEVAVFDRALDPGEVEEVYQLGLSLASLSGQADDPNLISPRKNELGQVAAVPQQREATISIQNRGSAQTLNISAINVSGTQPEHFKVIDFPQALAPSEAGTITYQFDSLGRTGAFFANLEVESDDSGDPLISIEVSASVVNLQGPQAHYRLDELRDSVIVRDSSGNDRHGEYIGGAGGFGLGAPPFFGLGGPPFAEGTSIVIGGGAEARISSDAFDGPFQTFSLALWFQVNGDLSADLRTLVGKGAVSPTFAILLQEGSLIWIEGDDPSPILSTEPNVVLARTAYHLVVISDQREGSERIALYLDGQLVAEAADLPRVLDESDAHLHIGAFNNALGFDGGLDDVQVYDRALTGEEVNDLLAAPGRTLGETTPVDSDGDGLSDADEVADGTDPLLKDTDGDGLEDGAELTTHGTNPTLADSDSDSFGDAFEIRQGTDPNDAASKPESSTVPGLFAYWRFDEGSGDVATDASGNGRDGVIISPDDVWEDAPGRGTVYHSNSSSYVEFGEIIPVMDLDNGFTWSFWINSDETSNNNIVLGNRYATDGTDFAPREFIKFTPSAFEWHVDGGGQNVDAEDFAVGEWVHHLVVKDGEALTYYQNGEVAGEGTISSAPANIQPLYIGGQNGVEAWSGLIEEVALWDRALSEAEVGSVLQLGEAGQSLAGGGGVVSPPSDATNDLAATRSADGVVLSWTEGETAAVQFSTDLIDWQAIAENLSEKSYTDTDAGRVSSEQGYYRLAR